MALIPLKHGLSTIVDDERLEDLLHYHWLVRPGHNTRYVYRFERRGTRYKRIHLHRQLLNCPEGMYIDHIDGDGLNNQVANLRIVTRTENQWNRRNDKSRCQYRGVYYRDNRWRAKIGVNGKTVNLGTYETPQEAAKAFDAAALRIRGPFAILNFPH
jgi:hypothetical protein